MKRRLDNSCESLIDYGEPSKKKRRIQNQRNNNKICHFWMEGWCKYGGNCWYDHPPRNDNHNQNHNHNNRRDIAVDESKENIRNTKNIQKHNNSESNYVDLTNDIDNNNNPEIEKFELNDEDYYNDSPNFKEMETCLAKWAVKHIYSNNIEFNHQCKIEEFEKLISLNKINELSDKLSEYMENFYALRRSSNYISQKYMLLWNLFKEQSNKIKNLKVKAEKYDNIHKITQEITNCGYDQKKYTSFCKDLAGKGKCKKKDCKFAHSVELCAIKDIAQDLLHHLAFLPHVSYLRDDLFWNENSDLKKDVERKKLKWMLKEFEKKKGKKKNMI